MPDRADVVLAILTLMLAVLAVVGRLVLAVLVWGERLLLALRGSRTLAHEPWRERIRVPDPSGSIRSATIAREHAE
jgi:hypothetical protein